MYDLICLLLPLGDDEKKEDKNTCIGYLQRMRENLASIVKFVLLILLVLFFLYVISAFFFLLGSGENLRVRIIL